MHGLATLPIPSIFLNLPVHRIENTFGEELFMKSHRSIFLGVLLLGIFISGSAIALDCTSPMTQVEMTQCTSITLERETSKINKTYSAVRAKLNPQKQAQLKDVQLAWIKFRDLSCKFNASGVEGGSAYSMLLSGCLTALTKERNRELEYLATCQEGDISCPAW
jgi:uncharacterized protein YecT (DUF1311 family)